VGAAMLLPFLAMKIITTISIILFCIKAFPQNCIDTSVKVNIHAAGYKLTVKENIVDINDHNILLGNYNTQTDTGYYFTRLNIDNTINFAKKINFTPLPTLGFGCLVKSLKNGNYITAYNNTTNYFVLPDSSIRLILFDNTGNIIWAKKILRVGGLINAILIDEMTNGDLIFLLKLQYGFDGLDIPRFGLMKINQVGALVWCKQFDAVGMGVSDLKAESFSIINNLIYLKGFFEKPFNHTPSVMEHRWFTAKINAANGTVINSKSFTDLRVDDEFEQSLILPFYPNQVSTTNNNLLFTNVFVNESRTKRGTTKIILDTNLNIVNATFFSYSNANFRNTRIIGNNEKEVFIYGNTINSNILSTSYFAKFDSNNVAQRESFLNYPNGSIYKPIGDKPIGLKNKYLNILNSFTQTGDTYLQLVQFPDDVPLTDCYGIDTNIVKIEPYTINPVLNPFINETIDITDIVITNLPVSISSLSLIAEKQCTIISDCNNIKIKSTPDSFCNINNEVMFSAHINGACLKKVYWLLDTSAYSYIRTINDTTVAIKFKKTWQGYLYAGINTCSSLKDSVYLSVFNSPISLNIGNDTSICVGTTLIIKADKGFTEYLWQNGSIADSLIATAPGMYSLITKDACGNIFKDTITVKYILQPALINFGNDTTLCKNETYTLQAGKGFKTYVWQDGSIADSFNIAQPGKYFVTATDSCGHILTDTIVIKYFIDRSPVNLGADINFCATKTYSLKAGLGYKIYQWQDGSNAANFTATQPGIYFVNVMDSCGNKSYDTIVIKTEINNQIKIDFPNSICINDTATIKLSNVFTNYNLAATSTGLIEYNFLKLFPTQNTIYTLEALTTTGCKRIDTILIKIKYCSDAIYFPSAFTPNGDVINDYYRPISESSPLIYELNIYNRFGQKIFTSNDIKVGWNGKLKEIMQNTGSFIWTCKYQFRDKPLLFKSGSLLLIR